MLDLEHFGQAAYTARTISIILPNSMCPETRRGVACICSLRFRFIAIMRHVRFSKRSWFGSRVFVLLYSFHICVARGSFRLISSGLSKALSLAAVSFHSGNVEPCSHAFASCAGRSSLPDLKVGLVLRFELPACDEAAMDVRSLARCAVCTFDDEESKSELVSDVDMGNHAPRRASGAQRMGVSLLCRRNVHWKCIVSRELAPRPVC